MKSIMIQKLLLFHLKSFQNLPIMERNFKRNHRQKMQLYLNLPNFSPRLYGHLCQECHQKNKLFIQNVDKGIAFTCIFCGWETDYFFRHFIYY
jgi:hypothetical protein